MDCVIGLDIGTTSTTGILIEPTGGVLSMYSRAVTLSAPRPGWAEEDPHEWWRNVCAIVPELLATGGVDAAGVKAVCVTGMLPAVVLLDEHEEVLRASIQQSDARCAAQVLELASEVPQATFVAQTGNGINQQLVATKLRWLERHEPAVFARIATVFGSYDYINWRLTGVLAVEQNWALEAGFVDLTSGELDEALIELAHISCSAIPPLSRAHQVLGAVTPAAAMATGLAAGTPVTGGAADHIASAYAAGVTERGDALLKFGGSADILVATDTATPDARMFLDYHLIPGLYMPNGCMASGGSALNWFINTFATAECATAEQQGMTAHAYLDLLTAQTPPGADGVYVLPYFLGEKTPIHDTRARGAFLGLSFNHSVSHLWRALLESFGYAFRHHIEVLNDMGHPTRRFLASDGGAQSRLWLQICADVLGAPVQRLDGHPGSCLGAAWAGAIAVGISDDWKGVERFVSAGECFEPAAATRALYEDGYRRYRSTYEVLAAIGQL
jgi:xylulokinase